jgi:hypothetical protein
MENHDKPVPELSVKDELARDIVVRVIDEIKIILLGTT